MRSIRISRPYYGWYVVAALFFATFTGVGARQGFGIFVETWEKDFGVSTSVISIAAAVGWIANGVSQPIFGILSDRLGGKPILVFGTLVLGIGTIAVAASPNPWVLMILYGLVCSFASGAVSFTPAGTIVSRWFIRNRGKAMGLLAAGGSVSGIVMIPFLAYFLLATSWQTVWIVVGVFTIVVGVPLLAIVLKNHPKDMGLLPDGNAPVGDSNAENINVDLRGEHELKAPLSSDSWRDSFRSAPMWQLSIAYWVCGVTTASISVHFVRWASSEGIAPQNAAVAFGVLSAINAIGVFTVGYFSDRMQRKNLLGAVYLIRGLAFVSLVVLPGYSALWAFAIIGGASWLATVPLTTSIAADVYGVKHIGVLAGLINFSHQLGGGLAVILFGLVFDKWETYDPAFIAGAITLLVAGIVSLSIREKRYSVRYSRSYS